MKVIVLGGGVIGTTTAYYLARSGAEVTLLDRQAGPPQETSFAQRRPGVAGLLDAVGRAGHSAEGD